MGFIRSLLRVSLGGALAVGALAVPLGSPASAIPRDVLPGTSTVVRVPETIDATGRTDVTAQLNSFLDGIPAHSIVSFPAHGRFRVEDVVTLEDMNDVTLDGEHATLFSTSVGYRERALLSLVGGSDLTLRDFVLEGGNPNGGAAGVYAADAEGQHGIRVRGSQRVLIEGTTITDMRGDFIYLGRDLRKKTSTWGRSSSDVVVRDNTMARNGRQGISITQASRVLISHNTISDVRRTVFDLEPNASSWVVEDVTISHNQVGIKHLNFLSSTGPGPVNDVVVRGNVLHGSPMNSMIKNKLGNQRRNWRFIGNIADKGFGSPQRGVVVAIGVEGLAFLNNTQPMNPRRNMVGVRLNHSCGADVTGNAMINSVAQSMGPNPACPSGVTLGSVSAPRPMG